MDPVHDKQWCDTQVRPILKEAKRQKKYPPKLDSVGVGNQNANWIVREYGRLHREGIDTVMDEFLDSLQKDLQSFGFNNGVELREAVYGAAGKLFTEGRGHIRDAMMKRGLDPMVYEDLRTKAFDELESGRDDLNEHIEARVKRLEPGLVLVPAQNIEEDTMTGKNGGVQIGTVHGGVTISHNQTGGITAGQHTAGPAGHSEGPSGLTPLQKGAAIATIVAAILALLTWLGYTLNQAPAPSLAPSRSITIPAEPKVPAEPKTQEPPIQRSEEKQKAKLPAPRKEGKPVNSDQKISIGQVTGDVVISNNQSGGITAKSVTINAKRSLTPETADKLRELLAPYRGSTVKITSLFGDGEAFQYAAQFQKVFEAAGWKVDGVYQGAYTVPPIGLLLNIQDEKSYAKNVDIIQTALKHVGLDVGANVDASAKPDAVELLVGGR